MKKKRLVSVSDTYSLFDTCIKIVDGFVPCFVFSRVLHSDLVSLFLDAWPGDTSKSCNSLTVKHHTNTVRIFLLEEDEFFIQFIASRGWVAEFLCKIFSPGSWSSKVRSESDVPAAFWTSIYRKGIDCENLFPNILVNHHPAESCVCVGRIFLWATRGSRMNCDEQDVEIIEEEEDSDIGSEQELSIIEEESLRDNLLVAQRDNTEEEENSLIRPLDCYTISAVAFTLACILEKEESSWDAREIYSFFRDWLSDRQSVILEKKSKKVIDAAKCLLRRASCIPPEPEDSVWPIEECEKLFFNVRGMLKLTSRVNKSPRPRLVRFKYLEKQDLISIYPGATEDIVGLSFTRYAVRHRSASPMQLHGTMEFLKWKFKNTSFWKVLFDSKRTILVIKKSYLDIILNIIMPYVAQSAIKRDPFPLYPFHLRNFFGDDLLGRSLAMRFLVSCFSIKTHISLDMTSEIVHAYRYLAVILDRVGSKTNILEMFTEPLDDDSISYPKGIRRDTNTIYSAIVGLANLSSPHYISYWGIEALNRVFMKISPSDFPIVYKVFDSIFNSRDPLDIHTLIPPDCLDFCDFAWPPHLALYIFCCATDVPSDEAIEIFLSISSGTKNIEAGGPGRRTETLPVPVPAIEFKAAHKTSLSDEKKKCLRRAEKSRRKELERGVSGASYAKKKGEPVMAADFIFQTIESMFSLYEDNSNLTPEEIMKGSTPVLPIDSDIEGPLYSDQTFPVFSGISREYSFSKVKGVHDACPLFGAHEDFLPCVFTNPITDVQE